MKKLNYIGLNVHKKNTVTGESRLSGEAQVTGEFINTERGIKKLLTRLNKLQAYFL